MKLDLKQGGEKAKLSNGMRILIVTPLYPPDIAGAAPYVKELARRLCARHTVTILAYNHIPEAVEGVRIIPIEKSSPLPLRLFRFFRVLLKEMQDADIVFTENGPSVELPVFFASILRRRKMVLHLGDNTALEHATTSLWYRIPLLLAKTSADVVLAHREGKEKTPPNGCVPRPHIRPEVLPFDPFPEKAMSAYEASWAAHVDVLDNIFSNI